MIKYISKLFLDILPSVVATIIGAYVVNHFIISRPEAPPSAIAVTAQPNRLVDAVSPAKAEIKPAEAAAKAASGAATDPGEKRADKSVADQLAAEKTIDKPSDRHHPAPHEKVVAKTAPTETTGALHGASAVEPASPEERRDANELARAAIERLRLANPSEASLRTQEASRAEAARAEAARAEASRAEASRLEASRLEALRLEASRVEASRAEATRVQEASRTVAPIQPLPPSMNVAMPAAANPYNPGGAATSPTQNPSYTYSANGGNDPRRPRPPAEIPVPAELQADDLPPPRPTVAEDVLLAARSVFQAVLPR
ncbi:MULTISPECIES: hypothetical protein [Rhodopseudomonas]|uniref:hypothetical protein n=1 Tax=Rhodopseudomonas TaxID=1073 RepID=UPI000697E7B2|nr:MULTISPECIES: hypothetical protein [Rhodopseudomonas]MDF3813506.1 hypothetical protein [Rhodopseudomonas sp. BAL398]WOK15357.1 hypothetical protein RBJ75_14245 [Rhodopseudomonas sp. BAL398]